MVGRLPVGSAGRGVGPSRVELSESLTYSVFSMVTTSCSDGVVKGAAEAGVASPFISTSAELALSVMIAEGNDVAVVVAESVVPTEDAELGSGFVSKLWWSARPSCFCETSEMLSKTIYTWFQSWKKPKSDFLSGKRDEKRMVTGLLWVGRGRTAVVLRLYQQENECLSAADGYLFTRH